MSLLRSILVGCTLSAIAVACSGQVQSESVTASDEAGTSPPKGDSGAVVVDARGPEVTTKPPDASVTKSTSLFQRFGGEAGISSFVDAVLAEAMKDPEIASYFAPNALTPTPANKPSTAQIKACFVLMLSAASADPARGDPATYVYPGNAAGWSCRTMDDAHAALHIGNGTFDKFAAIATSVAKAGGISDSDLAAIHGFLLANKAKIVDPSAPDGGFFVFDAG